MLKGISTLPLTSTRPNVQTLPVLFLRQRTSSHQSCPHQANQRPDQHVKAVAGGKAVADRAAAADNTSTSSHCFGELEGASLLFPTLYTPPWRLPSSENPVPSIPQSSDRVNGVSAEPRASIGSSSAVRRLSPIVLRHSSFVVLPSSPIPHPPSSQQASQAQGPLAT